MFVTLQSTESTTPAVVSGRNWAQYCQHSELLWAKVHFSAFSAVLIYSTFLWSNSRQGDLLSTGWCSFLVLLQTSHVAACNFITVVFHLGAGSVPLRSKLFALLYFSYVLCTALQGLWHGNMLLESLLIIVVTWECSRVLVSSQMQK